MSIPFSFEDSLRKHDLAVHNWLAGLTVNYDNIAGTPRIGAPILVTQATPDRAFATIPDILVSRGWISGASAAEMRENAESNFDTLPLPICSILRGEPVVDYEQAGPAKSYRTRFIDPVTQKWVTHRWPGSWRTDYTLTFWSKKRYTEAYIREWVMAQLGALGAASSELFIPVNHAAPWGVIPQSFKFTGSSDLTELEGDEQRYIRFEMMFSMRMMLMYTPTVATESGIGYPITSVRVEAHSAPDGVHPVEGVSLGVLSGFAQSDNLFALILPPDYFPLHWPKTGAATVSASEIGPDGVPDGLKLTVNTSVDSVELAERPVALDGQGDAVLQVTFAYLSDAVVTLEVVQRDPNTDILTAAHTKTLPATGGVWKRVNLYTLVRHPIFAVAVVGAGAPATAYVADVDLRHIFSQAFVVFTSQAVVGPNMEYRWAGLPNDPVLVRAVLVATPGPVPFVVENDVVSPTVSDTVLIDSAENVGFASLMQPKAGSLVLRVPTLVALASVALHRYGGHYHRNEV